jgi:mRNA-degrading endonuclease RelE of RelBE toxin-antitoxin system
VNYQPYSTGDFDAALKKLTTADRTRVDKTIRERLCPYPYRNSKMLSGSYSGLRSFRVGKLRIIYLIVAEVRSMGLEDTRPHLDCTRMPDKAIKLLFVDFRKDVYKWNP